MRSLSVLISPIGITSHAALAQPVAERDTLVKDETFAAPAALRFRHAFEIFENAALEVVDLGKAARQQIARRLLAADASGAEHRYSMRGRIEMARGKILELPKALDARIDGAFESGHRHLECIAGVD